MGQEVKVFCRGEELLMVKAPCKQAGGWGARSPCTRRATPLDRSFLRQSGEKDGAQLCIGESHTEGLPYRLSPGVATGQLTVDILCLLPAVHVTSAHRGQVLPGSSPPPCSALLLPPPPSKLSKSQLPFPPRLHVPVALVILIIGFNIL